MSEKKWTSEDMSAAVERALQTMEGVALELYRRGRKPLLEELETVKRERDEARADLARSVAAWESAGMQGRTAHDAMLALAKERDEARASAADQFRRGAEAMREACQQWCRAWENDGEAIADALADLSIPEEP